MGIRLLSATAIAAVVAAIVAQAASPAQPKTTDASGSVVVTGPAGKKGSFALTATKAGYVPAKGKASL